MIAHGYDLGTSHHGGFAEYVAVPARNAVALPDEVPFEQGATLMCASATSFHALRKSRLKPGETVTVVVKVVEPEKRRISLSLRDAEGDPWSEVLERFPAGKRVEGVIEKKEKFGYFVRLAPGITGAGVEICGTEGKLWITRSKFIDDLAYALGGRAADGEATRGAHGVPPSFAVRSAAAAH